MNKQTVSYEEYMQRVVWFQDALERKAEEVFLLTRVIESLELKIRELEKDKL